jgi:hypothetical protein
MLEVICPTQNKNLLPGINEAMEILRFLSLLQLSMFFSNRIQ